MDDPRIEWIRDRVYLALDIKDQEVFSDLLERDDGEAERSVQQFLNETPEDCENAGAVVFYKDVVEEEEEVEVECGNYVTYAHLICHRILTVDHVANQAKLLLSQGLYKNTNGCDNNRNPCRWASVYNIHL